MRIEIPEGKFCKCPLAEYNRYASDAWQCLLYGKSLVCEKEDAGEFYPLKCQQCLNKEPVTIEHK